MEYNTVLFDLDHTLLDTEQAFEISFDATMRSVGAEHPPSVRSTFDTINGALWRSVEQGSMNPDQLHQIRFQQFFEALDIKADPLAAASCFAESQIDAATLYPGAAQLIDQTCARSKTAIVTNGISSIQRGVLKTLGLDHTFDAIVISGEVGLNKPNPAFFDATFAALDVTDRSATVMVGDSLTSDIQGGTNAGIDTIWLNRRNANPGSTRPTHTVDSLEALARLLQP